MNTHGITIEETFNSIGYAIQNGSYPTMDFLFNVVISMLVLGTAAYIIWFAYSMIKIHNGD